MDPVWMYLSQHGGKGGHEREVRLGKFLCDDWTALGADQSEWHSLPEGRHRVESFTSDVCALRPGFVFVTSRSRTCTPTAGGQTLIRMFHNCKNVVHICNFPVLCYSFLAGWLNFSYFDF